MISQVNFVNLVVVAETLAAIHLVAYYLQIGRAHV